MLPPVYASVSKVAFCLSVNFSFFFFHSSKTICLRLHWPKLNSWKWMTITKNNTKNYYFSVFCEHFFCLLWTLYPPAPSQKLCVCKYLSSHKRHSHSWSTMSLCTKTAIIISKPSNKTLLNAHILGIIYLDYLWMAHRYYVPNPFTFPIDLMHVSLHLIIQHSRQYRFLRR